jgi:hypothetical protein
VNPLANGGSGFSEIAKVVLPDTLLLQTAENRSTIPFFSGV